jgi:hypothetical protein
MAVSMHKNSISSINANEAVGFAYVMKYSASDQSIQGSALSSGVEHPYGDEGSTVSSR